MHRFSIQAACNPLEPTTRDFSQMFGKCIQTRCADLKPFLESKLTASTNVQVQTERWIVNLIEPDNPFDGN